MKLTKTYDKIKETDKRCREIVQELRELPPIEYCPQETRELNNEYLRNVDDIIRLCDVILESESDDVYGEEVDFRIKLTYFQERYEHIRDSIK